MAEVAVGALLVAVALLGGAAVAVRPRANAFDRLVFTAIRPAPGSVPLTRVTDLASPAVLVAAAVVAGLVALTRDRRRAVGCILGPAAVAVLVELVLKPVVGRHYQGVLSYPSGNVADTAAVCAAWTLATPRWLRPVAAIAGSAITVAMAVAVIGLRWHYPSDALGGVLVGVGVVLGLDGALHLGRAPVVPSGGRAPGGLR